MHPDSPSQIDPADSAATRRLAVYGALFLSGLILILVGLVLLAIAFFKGYDTLYNPSELKQWLALRNEIHGIPPTNKDDPAQKDLWEKAIQSLLRKGPGKDFVMGGYAILIIALLYLYVLARISMAMLSRGSELLLQATKYWKESEKDAS